MSTNHSTPPVPRFDDVQPRPDAGNSQIPVSTHADDAVGKGGNLLTLDQFCPSVATRIHQCIAEINALKTAKESILSFHTGALTKDKSKLMLHVYHFERITLKRLIDIKLACEKHDVTNPCIRFDGSRLHKCEACKVGSIQLQVNLEPGDLLPKEDAKLPSLSQARNTAKPNRWRIPLPSLSNLGFLNFLPGFRRKAELSLAKKRKPVERWSELETEKLSTTEDGEIRVPKDVSDDFQKCMDKTDIDTDDQVRVWEVIKSLYARCKITNTRTERIKDHFNIINNIPVAETISYEWLMSIYDAHRAFLLPINIFVDMEHHVLVVEVHSMVVPRRAVITNNRPSQKPSELNHASAPKTEESDSRQADSPSQAKKQRTV